MDSQALVFDMPRELIAQHPSPRRGDARMMVVHRATGRLDHRRFEDFLEYLSPDQDALILNNSRVIPARLTGRRPGGSGQIDVLLVSTVKKGSWKVLIRPSPTF